MCVLCSRKSWVPVAILALIVLSGLMSGLTVSAADQAAANSNNTAAKSTASERAAKVRAELKHVDRAVRRAAIGGLIHSDLSDGLLPEMRATLGDVDGDIRSTAATAIGNLGAAALPAVPQLLAQLKKDPVKEARETAARALGRIGKVSPEGKSQAIAPLTTASKEDADPVTRVVALGALAMMDVELANQIASLRKYLQDDEGLVRMKASHALGMLGAPAKAAAPEIVKVLERETDHHRIGYVARALGNTGDPASLPALYAALEKEKDPGAIGEMRGAIGKLGGKLPEKTK